jgi:hypothetical protein
MQRPAQVGQQPQPGRRHSESAPPGRCAVEHRPHQLEAGVLAGQPADDLDPAPGLTEGAFDEVGVPHSGPVITRAPQVHRQRVTVIEQVRAEADRRVRKALARLVSGCGAVRRGCARRSRPSFEAWSARRLDDVELDYLFLDGSHFKYHANASAEPVLAAWGIDTDGKPVFVGLDASKLRLSQVLAQKCYLICHDSFKHVVIDIEMSSWIAPCLTPRRLFGDPFLEFGVGIHFFVGNTDQ